MKKHKKLIWMLVALLLVVLTFRTVLRMSSELSLRGLAEALRTADRGWLALSLLAALGFIVLEGEALLMILRVFGCRRSHGEGLLYSAADIYFSAVTPSASGGQPASAYFMLRSGVPGAMVTVTLLVNLIAYTTATLTAGVLALALRFDVFLALGRGPKLLVLLGFALLTVLTAMFYGLLRHGEQLYQAGAWGLRVLLRLRLLRDDAAALEKLRGMVDQYKDCARQTEGKRASMFAVYLLDLGQRLAQISVSTLVHLALGGAPDAARGVWTVSALAQIGSNCLPVPGGMGFADYLLYHGFLQFLPREAALRLELISRSMSFYLCMVLCGLVSLAGYLTLRKKKVK